MNTVSKCECNQAPRLIFACSGAADVGELADRAARTMMKRGYGKMFCLAGIGGQVSGIIKSTESAKSVLAIDGCPLNCAKKCLEEAGFNDFKHLQITELGIIKGQTEINKDNIDSVLLAGSELLKGAC